MIATTLLPMCTLPPMNHKRSRSTGLHVPNSKRFCLDAEVEHTENNDVLKSTNRQAMLLKVLPPTGRTACMQPSALVHPSHKNISKSTCATASSLSNNGLAGSKSSCRQVNGYKNERKTNFKTSPSISEHNSLHEEEIPTEDMDSSFVKKSKSKTKQPAVFVKVNHCTKQSPLPSISPRSYEVSTEVSSVIFQGYVHRMASLNARACVAAFLQPERRTSPKLTRHNGHNKPDRSRAKRNSMSESSKLSLLSKVDTSKSKAVVLNLSAIENAIPVIKLETNGLDIPACAVIVQSPNDHYDEQSEVPYNKMGLLYNGDTVHPHTQVFLTQSHNNELEFPSRIVPTLVPSRLSTVKIVVRKATTTGVLPLSKRNAKKNNGWQPLGDPIKVIRNCQGVSKMPLKYYAGIKRKNEEIYVRDCVVINADTEKEESPYVAKIGSIWQESDGSVMMTTFWYYRSEDVEVQNAGVECLDREVLASQHHDSNSVECIEDKCYILGLSQFCRYQASLVKCAKLGGSFSHNIVPCPSSHNHVSNNVTKPGHNNQPAMDTDDNDLVELDPKKQQQQDLGPSLCELQGVDPSLVYLCYRGFNHISGRAQNGTATCMLPRMS